MSGIAITPLISVRVPLLFGFYVVTISYLSWPEGVRIISYHTWFICKPLLSAYIRLSGKLKKSAQQRC